MKKFALFLLIVLGTFALMQSASAKVRVNPIIPAPNPMPRPFVSAN